VIGCDGLTAIKVTFRRQEFVRFRDMNLLSVLGCYRQSGPVWILVSRGWGLISIRVPNGILLKGFGSPPLDNKHGRYRPLPLVRLIWC